MLNKKIIKNSSNKKSNEPQLVLKFYLFLKKNFWYRFKKSIPNACTII